MDNLPTKYILSKQPKEYLTQGISHCGAYSIKGMLSAYGLDNRSHPKDYHPYWLGKLTGLTLGWNYFPKILGNYGLNAKTDSAAGLSNSEKLNLLKKLLSNNTPVMIKIGNGYFRSKKYNPLIGKILTHWVTLWGYDDKKQLFYMYDSGLPKQLWAEDIPIGNTTRTYSELLRDWNFGKLQPWSWQSSIRNFTYVEVKNKL